MAQKAADSAFGALVNALGSGVIALVKFMSSFWLKMPSPTVATGGGDSWTAVQSISDMQMWLMPVTAAIAALSFAFQLARMALRGTAEEGMGLVRMLINVASAPALMVAGTEILILAGDQFTPWVIQQASGGDPSAGMNSLITQGLANGQPTSSLGMWLIVFILCLLGSIAQCLFMLCRAPMLMLLMCFIAPTAAASATPEGQHRFKRLAMLILGFVLYKPVAGIIYGFGIAMMGKQTSDGGVQSALYGLVVMIMAALALPAMIKFLAPPAAMGSSSLASGAAVAGAAAAGAAVIANGGIASGGSAAARSGSASTPPPPAPSASPGSSGPAPSGAAAAVDPPRGGGGAPAGTSGTWSPNGATITTSAGATGATGAAGTDGAVGPAGTDGAMGSPGAVGSSGQNGSAAPASTGGRQSARAGAQAIRGGASAASKAQDDVPE